MHNSYLVHTLVLGALAKHTGARCLESLGPNPTIGTKCTTCHWAFYRYTKYCTPEKRLAGTLWLASARSCLVLAETIQVHSVYSRWAWPIFGFECASINAIRTYLVAHAGSAKSLFPTISKKASPGEQPCFLQRGAGECEAVLCAKMSKSYTIPPQKVILQSVRVFLFITPVSWSPRPCCGRISVLPEEGSIGALSHL